MWVWPVTARTQYGLPEAVPYAVIMILHVGVLAAALAGILTSLGTAVSRLFLALILATAAPFLVFYPEPRYALPALPFLLASAGAFFARALTVSRVALQAGTPAARASNRLW
jgi:hypothetical protein